MAVIIEMQTNESVKQAYCRFMDSAYGAQSYREFKQLLYKQGDSLVGWLNSRVIPSIAAAKKSSVNVCDVGSGDGSRAMQLLCSLHEKFGNTFLLHLVDQSAHHAAAWEKAIVPSFCERKTYNERFEVADLSPGSFDLVLLIHSIFAFETDLSIERVLSLPSDGGCIVVVSNAPDSFLAGLKRRVDADFSDRRFEICDLQTNLDERGVSYLPPVTTFTEWVVTNEFWDRDLSTLLNWISLGRYESMSDRSKFDLELYVRSRGRVDGDLTFFREEEVALIIPSHSICRSAST